MKEIYSKLMRVQQQLKCEKGQFNSFGSYSYRSCEDILASVKPLLAKEGLVLLMTDEIQLIGDRYYVVATATISDGEDTISTSAFAREQDKKKGMDESQVTGACSSYARKYSLNGLFGIDNTKDADALPPEEAEPANDMITAAQIKIINAYPDVTKDWLLNKYSVSTVEELSRTQATEAITLVKKAREAKEKENE